MLIKFIRTAPMEVFTKADNRLSPENIRSVFPSFFNLVMFSLINKSVFELSAIFRRWNSMYGEHKHTAIKINPSKTDVIVKPVFIISDIEVIQTENAAIHERANNVPVK